MDVQDRKKDRNMFSNPVNIVLYNFGSYLVVMVLVLGISVCLHELGHIVFARANHLEYRVFFAKGNLTVAADWERLGSRKVYGNLLGIIIGLPPVVAAGWLYSTPVFIVLYLVACYDDFGAVARELLNCRKVFV